MHTDAPGAQWKGRAKKYPVCPVASAAVSIARHRETWEWVAHSDFTCARYRVRLLLIREYYSKE